MFDTEVAGLEQMDHVVQLIMPSITWINLVDSSNLFQSGNNYEKGLIII